MKNIRRDARAVHAGSETHAAMDGAAPMNGELRERLVEAATDFANKLATAVEAHRTAGDWVDQDTCAPLTKRKFLALTRSGTVQARAFGKQRLVRRRDLDRYIERRAGRVRASAAPRTDAEIEALVLADLDLRPSPTKERS